MGAGHDHEVAGANRARLGIAFAITATVLVAEVVGALLTGSLALLVDAAHMLTDAGGLLLALLAATAMARPPTAKRTWGWARIEILAAGGQAAILLAVGLYAFIEGVQRLLAPPEVAAGGLLVLGIVGLVANIVAVLVLSGGRGHNLNMRAAFLEVVNDAFGSVAVIVSALVIQFTGWTQADAVAGMLISVLILPRAVSILRQAGSVLLETVPKGLDLGAVRGHLLELPHVTDVHDLHASLIGTGLPVLTAHIVLEDRCFHDGHSHELLDQLQDCVRQHFDVSVEHSTFQLEPASHSGHEDHTHA
jgi:cobalt-zinc-cadmium efflux system protein